MIWKKIIVAMLAVSVVFSGCARHGEIDTETSALTERVSSDASLGFMSEQPVNDTAHNTKIKINLFFTNISPFLLFHIKLLLSFSSFLR